MSDSSKIDPPKAAAYDPEKYKELIQEVAKVNADHDGWFLASVSPVIDEEGENFNKAMGGAR